MVSWQSLLLISILWGLIIIDNSFVHATNTELQQKATQAYAQIAPCLKAAWIYQAKYGNNSKHAFAFPTDAEAHYEEVKKALSKFRKSANVHSYRHYSGPWVENIFITHFQGKSLQELNGIIPLFVPWVDNQRTGDELWQNIFDALKAVIRPTVIYIAVSQGDIGLAKIGEYFPNILVLSGGGFGHVPIPLIKGEIPYKPITVWPPKWDQEIGFFGNLHQASRPTMFDYIRQEADKKHMTHKIAFGPTWIDMMSKSKFNLAPRGFGRSSFRFAEAIHIGRVPVFLFDDVAWIPYLHSALDIHTYGYLAGLNATHPDQHFSTLIDRLQHTSDEEYKRKHEMVQKMRVWFTYAGVMVQIERLLQNPFPAVSPKIDKKNNRNHNDKQSNSGEEDIDDLEKGNFLRCTPVHPRQEHDTLRR